jgi:polyisoprenoid-binding protein YceI
MLGDKVLDAARYAQIQFTSSGVRSITQREGVTELQVDGTLRVHGVASSRKKVKFARRSRTGVM